MTTENNQFLIFPFFSSFENISADDPPGSGNQEDGSGNDHPASGDPHLVPGFHNTRHSGHRIISAKNFFKAYS